MNDFATKMDFVKILNKLESYTTLDSFNKMRIAQERENQDRIKEIRDLVPKALLSKEIETMKVYVGEVNK